MVSAITKNTKLCYIRGRCNSSGLHCKTFSPNDFLCRIKFFLREFLDYIISFLLQISHLAMSIFSNRGIRNYKSQTTVHHSKESLIIMWINFISLAFRRVCIFTENFTISPWNPHHQHIWLLRVKPRRFVPFSYWNFFGLCVRYVT